MFYSILPYSIDSVVQNSELEATDIPFFFTKAIILIGVVIVIFLLVGNVNKYRDGLAKKGKNDLREFLKDELTLDQNLSLTRLIVYYSIIVFLVALPLFLIVHLAVAILVPLFLACSLTVIIYFDVFVRHSRVVINRTNRTVTLSSKIGGKHIKPEVVKPFKELVFTEQLDEGFIKYGLSIDKFDSKKWCIWDGFSSSERDLILDWLRETSVENFRFENR